MQINTEEKNLVESKNENGFFTKLKNFFRNLFSKNTEKSLNYDVAENNKVEIDGSKKSEFVDSIKVDNTVEADEEVLELQRKLRANEITMNDLTEEQVDKLIDLYDKQIAIKKAKIEDLKRKIERAKKAS